MPGDRKEVAICSRSDSFSKGLRLMLEGIDVTTVQNPEELATAPDTFVWRTEDSLPTEKLEAIASSTPTLVLGRAEHLIPAVDAGCMGFLSHEAPLDEISAAVRTVLDGGAVVPPDLLGTILHHLVQRRRKRMNISGLDTLTARELEVYQLAMKGLRKEEIGERLYISPDTARTHLQRVYRKLGVHSHAELVALGAVTDDSPGGP